MRTEDKLGNTRFKVREESHIRLAPGVPERRRAEKLCLACPAGLYSLDGDGRLLFSHLGCLECGTCRLLGWNRELEAWDYPVCDFGVQYRNS